MSQKVKFKNKTSKFNKKILIVLLVIVIIVIVVILNRPKKQVQVGEEPDWEQFVADTKEYLNDKVLPQNIYDFSHEYVGEYSKDEIYQNFYTLSRYFPDLCSDLKKTDEKGYYSRFSDKIKEYMGIENESEFLEVAEIFKQNDVSGLEFEYCRYNSNSFKKEENYSTFEIDFKYKDIEPITIKLEVLNKKVYNKPMLKVIP